MTDTLINSNFLGPLSGDGRLNLTLLRVPVLPVAEAPDGGAVPDATAAKGKPLTKGAGMAWASTTGSAAAPSTLPSAAAAPRDAGSASSFLDLSRVDFCLAPEDRASLRATASEAGAATPAPTRAAPPSFAAAAAAAAAAATSAGSGNTPVVAASAPATPAAPVPGRRVVMSYAHMAAAKLPAAETAPANALPGGLSLSALPAPAFPLSPSLFSFTRSPAPVAAQPGHVSDTSQSPTISLTCGGAPSAAPISPQAFIEDVVPLVSEHLRNFSQKASVPPLRPRGFINSGNMCFMHSVLSPLIHYAPIQHLMASIPPRHMQALSELAPFLKAFADLMRQFEPLTGSGSQPGTAPTSPNKRQPVGAGATVSTSSGPLNGVGISADQFPSTQGPLRLPQDILTAVHSKKGLALTGNQEDAEEFLGHILMLLHEEFCEILQYDDRLFKKRTGRSRTGQDDDDDDGWSVVTGTSGNRVVHARAVGSDSKFPTPISQIFWGRTRNIVKMVHSNTPSITFQPFHTIPLFINCPSVTSLEGAILNFVQEEPLLGFVDSNTGQPATAHRSCSFETLPPMIIFHMKRFVYTIKPVSNGRDQLLPPGGSPLGGIDDMPEMPDINIVKIRKPVSFPLHLQLPAESMHRSLSASSSYELHAVVNHHGPSAQGGHYTCSLNHPSLGWLRFDDSHVTPLASPPVITPAAVRAAEYPRPRPATTSSPRSSPLLVSAAGADPSGDESGDAYLLFYRRSG
ncbi:hypothetical protein H696_01271 [Fonticula alba]|uniref:ubiquitinyl hydrolase 1 n=1 Tax=Fonticula alba TaxID=691883 RepID=A0A058ZD49_FONAL|nr:hypothetical protein H696_01271 [Fonticula alba]KCV71858.1 hypothetical protein H696_01271 [Fonticula alba]|eukprot:XP_009493436.1 hypothetical protein H696_01271 [Fonticula alba]